MTREVYLSDFSVLYGVRFMVHLASALFYHFFKYVRKYKNILKIRFGYFTGKRINQVNSIKVTNAVLK